MTPYQAPLADMRFVLGELAGLEEIAALPGLGEATPDLVDAVLEEAGRFGAEVLAPLNKIGDTEGCMLENGVVRTPSGFRDAYARFVEGGWNGVPLSPDYGGQGLPWLVSTAVSEIWNAANLSFALCPMLTQGAVELLSAHGSPEQKALYLPKLVEGTWNGTMNLTEPQAGSDLARLSTRAVRDNGLYRITGQKIFITYGEHDFTENIIHMVLARLPDAPPGINGISLFIVPKFLVNADASLGPRNDVRCVSIEHKLGINASPTAALSFGDDGGAVGYLVGGENQGIQCMFFMMNNARLAVGLEGVAVGERAYQQARAYARERVQGHALGDSGDPPVTIDHHPDVRRMLLSMKAQVEATRSLAYYVAAAIDMAKRHPDEEVRRQKQAFADLMTPVVKAWSSDAGIDIANTGIQVHGGMGYIEETGAAQLLRDARIATIYEGTNGIQANDLMGRKVVREKGITIKAFIETMRSLDGELAVAPEDDIAVIRTRLGLAIDALAKATDWAVETYPFDQRAVAAGAVDFLRLFGIVSGGWLMAKGALAAHGKLAAGDGDGRFLKGRLASARYFADHLLSQAPMLHVAVTEGAAAVLAVEKEQF